MRKYEKSIVNLSRQGTPSRLLPGQPGEAAWTAQKKIWWKAMGDAYGLDIVDALGILENEIDD